MRELTGLLGITEGITTVVGSGGKTSLMRILSEELRDGCSERSAPGNGIILAASTRIFPFDGMPLYTGNDIEELRRLLERSGIVCAGTPQGTKLTAPVIDFRELADTAGYVLIEGDGSKNYPLKAHADHEPVIPDNTGNLVLVIGASGFDRSIRESVHRPELFCKEAAACLGRGDIGPDSPADPVLYADFVCMELEQGHIDVSKADRFSIFINQADTEHEMRRATGFAEAFRRAELLHGGKDIAIAAGSLINRSYCLI